MQLDLLSIAQVADKLGCSRQRVYQYIDSGRIPTVDLAGRKFVERKHAKKPKAEKPGPKAAD